MANASNVRVDTSSFERSHRKAPRGTGTWAFEVAGQTVFAPSMSSFTVARKWAQGQAVAAGATFVVVMP